MGIFHNLKTSIQKKREVFEGFPNSIHAEKEQQNRMVSADGKYLYVKDISKDQKSGTVVGEHGVYQTSMSQCSCPDFQERRKPCKHMYKLAFVTGKMDPHKYYHGDYQFRYCYRNIVPDNFRSDTAFADHMSVCKYKIQAVYKSTQRKRRRTIYALSEEDAIDIISGEFESPVISIAKEPYELPTDHQIIYAVSQGVSIPKGCCKEDLSALLSRYEEYDDRWKNQYLDQNLIAFGKSQRVPFSLLGNEPTMIMKIYQELDTERQIAFMVASLDKALRHHWNFQRWNEWMISAKSLAADAAFMKSCENHIDWFTGFEYNPPSKNTKIYKALKSVLEN